MYGALALVDDELFVAHAGPAGHPERPERLFAARAACAHADMELGRLELDPRDATDDELRRVHDDAYIELLGQSAGKQGYFDTDTYFGPQSVAAARRAAGGAVALVDALLDARASAGLGLLRPPGHHATRDTAMGFCLLNNAAVAAAHARRRGCARVAVVDWDVHHGNGTQDIFYADPSVLYVSLHQSPFYPGTGATNELGSGDGRGYTVNVPLGAGAGDPEYVLAFERIVCPIVEQYAPDLLLISAGYDAHERDPLASMRVTAEGYAAMLDRLLAVLPERGAGRIALLLEGGYDLVGLGESLGATLAALDGQAAARDGQRPPASERHVLEISRAAATLQAHWKLG